MSIYKSDKLSELVAAVNSILNQTYPCDLFIYRDGLVSVEIEEYIHDLNSLCNVTVICCDENNGLAYGLNTLIDLVVDRYEFIARMDSDDISYPERIQKQVDYLRGSPEVDVVGTFCREFGASYALEKKTVPVSSAEIVSFSISRCPFIHPTVVFRSHVFKNGFRYPINTKLTEDMALWFLLLDNGYVFSNVNEVLLDFRLTENTINRRKGVDKGISEFLIRLNYMFKLNSFSLKNFLLISSRLVFHCMPNFMLKLFYKHLR